VSCYVDALAVHGNARGIFLAGSCHLTADTLDELHTMAAKIGMKRAWFQDHPVVPHYDLVASRRAAAVEAGAIEMPMREQWAKGLGGKRERPGEKRRCEAAAKDAEAKR
jgi:hypothetical protein